MGRKLDALLGRTFKTSKFKALLNLAISRLSVLKNQRQVRYSQARSDVLQLLEIGHHERALLRVEQVIKEQNRLDVLVMVESYCNIFIDRLHLIEQHRVCPEELEEAASGLLFAASRCGDFPELQEIRAVLTSRFGKEFAARAIELRNNCRVNRKMIQKLSTKFPGLEDRMKVLKEIASESKITLQLDEVSPEQEKPDPQKIESQLKPGSPAKSTEPKEGDIVPEELENANDLSGSLRTRKKKYRDVADAAQAAFESAAYAAAAARAAFELSRGGSTSPDDQNSPGKPAPGGDHLSSETESKNQEGDNEIQAEDEKQIRDTTTEHRKSTSSSISSGSIDLSLDEVKIHELLQKDIVFDDSEDEEGRIEQKQDKPQNFYSDVKPSKISKDVMDTEKIGFVNNSEGVAEKNELGPISVRTRRVRGY